MGLYLNESGVLTPIAGRGDLTAIRSEMSYIGAKNLLPNNAVNQTITDVQLTVNNDGSVTASGTSSGTWNLRLAKFVLKAGTYILSGRGNANIFTQIVDVTEATNIASTENSIEKQFTIDSDTEVIGRIFWHSGVTFNNITMYPMIRLASDPDDTYQPYAMTNQALTESKANIIYGTNIWSANTPVTITLPRLGGLLVGGRSNKGFAIYVCENGNELVALSGGDFVTASISDLTISLTFSSVYGTSFNWKYINSETGSY